MHLLLLEEGKRRNLRYKPTSGPGGDRYGIDGRVMKNNILGINGPLGIEKLILSHPIQYSITTKKSLIPSQQNPKNNPNQKTNQNAQRNMGWEKSTHTHPHKEQKTSRSFDLLIN
jgi:hypothetical protein